MASFFSRDRSQGGSPARTDFTIIGTAVLVLLGFGSLGVLTLSDMRDALLLATRTHSSILAGLLLLTIALGLYGLRRHHDLRRELGERRSNEAHALSLASSDLLTGLLNKQALAEAAPRLLTEADAQQRGVALVVVDLDSFKAINETHGYLIGDSMLRTAAELIQKSVPAGALTARLGGDEFGALIPFDARNPAAIEAIAGHIVDRLGKPFDLAGVHVHISASIGLARIGGDCASLDDLLRRGDVAVRAARKSGRDCHMWFDVTMERELHRRAETEAGLRVGIPEGQIVPYFEQQVDLVTGTLHGFEMLARWEHPERGLVCPDEFIAIAEDAGLIDELSMSAMAQAFEEARLWDPSLSLSVNISASQIKDPWLAQKLVKLLVTTGFPAERLEVEITEPALFEQLGMVQTIVGSLKNQGIRIALDDFGAGLSALSHLRALPFDRIKIDRSFVAAINDDPASLALVTAITRLAESLDLAVTAEGIEHELIEARLRAIGNYKGQGWLFGRPMPASEVQRMLAERGLLPMRAGAEPPRRRLNNRDRLKRHH